MAKGALHTFWLFGLVVFIQRVSAAEFKVGGSNGWSVPSNLTNTVSYSNWAEMHRFQVGDSILFVYQPDKDSVVQVNKDDFASCNTAAPIATFNEGNTSFMFKQSGPYYFISGIKDNCLENEKMVVIVMADRNKQSSDTNTTAASPPSPLPPPPPPTEMVPAPAPTGEESPSPPAPPPSGASSMLVSLVSCVGAFVASSYLLVL